MSEPVVFSIPLPVVEGVRGGSVDCGVDSVLETKSSPTPTATLRQSLEIMMHRASDDNDDPLFQDNEEDTMHNTGLILWPSSAMLARYLAHNPSILYDCQGDILELGAGCGLVGLTAARLLQIHREEEQHEGTIGNKHRETDEGGIEEDAFSSVIMTDYSPEARENLIRNARLNNVQNFSSIAGLDFFDQGPDETDGTAGENHLGTSELDTWMDMDGNQQPQVNLILGADLIAYSNDGALVASTLHSVLADGGQAYIMGPDARYRFGLAGFPDACRGVGLEVEEEDMCSQDNVDGSESEGGHFFQDIRQTGGYRIESGYDFTMFTISKPCKA